MTSPVTSVLRDCRPCNALAIMYSPDLYPGEWVVGVARWSGLGWAVFEGYILHTSSAELARSAVPRGWTLQALGIDPPSALREVWA